MNYEFHPEALEEYEEAALYYAEHEPGLELKFVAAIEECIRRILDAPIRCA